MASVDDLCDKPWWHGYVPQYEADRLIEQPGDFFVRASSPGAQTEIVLTACDVSGNKVHAKLSYEVVWFFPPKEGAIKLSFPTVSDLMDFYIDHPTTNLKLTRIIPRLVPELRLDNIYFEGVHCIGKGDFASTFWGSLTRPYLGDKLSIAVKMPIIPEEKVNAMVSRKDQMLVEARKLLYCLHPNLAKFHGIAIDGTSLLIVSSHIPGKDLLRHLSRFGVLTDNREKLLYLVEVAAGVNYLHDRSIVHRAIGARNCLISTTGKIMLGDYGVNSIVDVGLGGRLSCWCAQRPALRWLAPETLNSWSAFSTASDCWSFGILAYEIYANAGQPWPKMTNPQIECEIRKGTGPEMPETTPERMVALLTRIWNANPQRRITIKQIGKEICNMIEDTTRLIGDFPAALLTLNRIPQVTRAVYFEPADYQFAEIDGVLTASQCPSNSTSRSSSETSLPAPPSAFGSTYINVGEGSITRSSSSMSLADPAPVASTYIDSAFKENSSVYVATPTGRGSGGSNLSNSESKSSTGSGIRPVTYSSDPDTKSKKSKQSKYSKKFYGKWNDYE